jgi:hydroxymethylbilane synthase
LWQADYVANLIKPSGYTTEIISVDEEHKGDPKKNLEIKLLEGSVDIVVHHGKDVPSDLHEELELVAFTERDLPNDAVISHQENLDLKSDTLKIGASSMYLLPVIYQLRFNT